MSAPWWQSAVLYQVYPRSFQDSNGDGIGDLAGITARLDDLVALGIDALWISPVFPSPMADFGYDVADYCDIDPRFGTLAEMDRLVAEAHARGLKVLLDYVPNHSSDQHPWFTASRSSRDDPKRDWYIWRDAAADGGPPNNWISDFGGPAWEWDAATGQYYAHAFLAQQPDLNWRSPELRAAMLDVLRFWFDRGIDGFRIDVLWHMIKHADFLDNPVNPDWHGGMAEMDRVHQTHSTDQPEVHDIAREMRAIADAAGERLLVGEIYLPVERLMDYYGGVHLPLNFQLIGAEWHAPSLLALIEGYERALPEGGWPNWVLGNHDRPRAATRFGAEQARVAAMLLLTLRGTPTIYYGDEIGMADVAIPAERVQDPRELREPGKGLGRDPVRTPMAWDDSANGGFTSGEPWLPLHADWPTRNMGVEREEAGSMWRLYRDLLALRRATPALALGEWAAVASVGEVLAYERRLGDARVLVVLNLGTAYAPFALPEWAAALSVVLSSAEGDADPRLLGPNEGLILA
ncbi:alpha-amylase family glycosyl hydrolase [Sphingomonas qomolangmaensis]|uniref:Alpha-amylase family glycosyl hydrolase n=1 Tax=Sphingomonas qomolangmaensis TaxID=2918765 RepID=A0ABY5L5N6_9SPHN|nr:alpha-amylase family glycosyl hydrolase [Sphingomonas qomolangmaensis]UUL82092.1 alpha-amylase family glycosyl hydrolase [Sphingomonas qomolangmaensis]